MQAFTQPWGMGVCSFAERVPTQIRDLQGHGVPGAASSPLELLDLHWDGPMLHGPRPSAAGCTGSVHLRAQRLCRRMRLVMNPRTSRISKTGPGGAWGTRAVSTPNCSTRFLVP